MTIKNLKTDPAKITINNMLNNLKTYVHANSYEKNTITKKKYYDLWYYKTEEPRKNVTQIQLGKNHRYIENNFDGARASAICDTYNLIRALKKTLNNPNVDSIQASDFIEQLEQFIRTGVENQNTLSLHAKKNQYGYGNGNAVQMSSHRYNCLYFDVETKSSAIQALSDCWQQLVYLRTLHGLEPAALNVEKPQQQPRSCSIM